MAVRENTTTSAQFDELRAREDDFVTVFGENWDALRKILGIMRPIKKEPGTRLVSYKVEVDGNLNGGTSVAEGDEIPLTKVKATPVEYADVEIAKYDRNTTIEAVTKQGGEITIEQGDKAFMTAIQNKILGEFYDFLKTGTLVNNETTWQRALAMAKGAVLNKFSSMNKDVTDVIGFANILDAYSYLGDQVISVQTMFGVSYIQNFMGYSTLFLLPDRFLEEGTVIAVPVDNIVLYYVDPSNSHYAKLGLHYTVVGETPLIGVHAEGDYRRASGDMFALTGMKLWAEYLDGIAVYTVGG